MIQLKDRFMTSQDLKKLIASGDALVIDVRTANEYGHGHLENAVNIPVTQLMEHFRTISNERPIITCCASGMRSEMAKNILVANGFSEVYNGGGWAALLK